MPRITPASPPNTLEVHMHQPSRRRFVAASLAGLPTLAGGTTSLFGSSFTLGGSLVGFGSENGRCVSRKGR